MWPLWLTLCDHERSREDPEHLSPPLSRSLGDRQGWACGVSSPTQVWHSQVGCWPRGLPNEVQQGVG